jgi:hypothetical protein
MERRAAQQSESVRRNAAHDPSHRPHLPERRHECGTACASSNTPVHSLSATPPHHPTLIHPRPKTKGGEGGEGAQLGTGGLIGRLLSLPYLARRSGGGVGEADVGHEDIRQRARGCRLGIEEW